MNLKKNVKLIKIYNDFYYGSKTIFGKTFLLKLFKYINNKYNNYLMIKVISYHYLYYLLQENIILNHY